jgi:hypothetical protein
MADFAIERIGDLAALKLKQPVKSYAPETKADLITSADVIDAAQGDVTWYGVFDIAAPTFEIKRVIDFGVIPIHAFIRAERSSWEEV